MIEYDIIIIGSGPAGSTAGIVLGHEKLRILMIEKKKLPRHKICSGMISKAAQKELKRIGLEFPEAICTRPKKGKGVKVQFALGKDFIEIPDRFYNVWRRDFDYWLVIEANKNGVKVEDETELIDIIYNNNDNNITIKVKYIDEISGEKKIKEYSTKYIIGADGGRSRVRKIIYPNFNRDTGIAYQEYWSGSIDIDPRYFHAFMDRELSSGYAFCNIKEDQIIIGVNADKGKGKEIKNYMKNFIKFLKNGWNLKLNHLIRREGCVTTNITKPNPVFQYLHGKKNSLLVGEAADLFNIMGEGIPSAIKSGANAAKAIIQHIQDESMDVIEIYTKNNGKLIEKIEKNWEGYKKLFNSLINL